MTRRAPAALAAALLPLLVLTGAATWLLQAPPTELSEAAAAMESAVAASKPRVVVLGNSVAQFDVDPAVLSAALDVPPQRFLKLTEVGSRPPTWYVILDNRVLQHGHRPELVLIVGTLSHFAALAPTTDAARDRLLAQLDPNDALVYAKTFGQDSPTSPAMRFRYGRARAREGFTTGVRDLVVGLFRDPGGPGTVMERGHALSATVQAGVFEADDMREDGRPQDDDATPATGLGAPAESFIPDLAALAARHRARLVFVRAPVWGTAIDQEDLGPVVEHAIIEAIRATGAGFVDLTDLPVDASHFQGNHHLNRTGARLFSQQLGEILAASPDGVVWRESTVQRVRFRAERHGEVPTVTSTETATDDPCRRRLTVTAATSGRPWPLPAERDLPLLVSQNGRALTPGALDMPGCTGRFAWVRGELTVAPASQKGALKVALRPEAPAVLSDRKTVWWVYPGTSLTLTFEAWEAESAGLRVLAAAAGGAGGEAWLEIDGERRPLGSDGTLATSLEEVRPSGPWTLAIGSPADGPYVSIQAIALGSRDAPVWAIGSDAVGVGRDDRIVGSRGTPGLQWSAPPPALAVDALRATSTRHGAFRLSPPLPPTRDDVSRVSPRRCTPVRVFEDGTELRDVPISRLGEPGLSAYDAGEIRFVATDGLDPTRSPERFTAALTPGRECQKARWLYPFDELRSPIGARRLAAMAVALDLRAVVVGPAPEDAALRVLVLSDTGTHLDRRLPLATLADVRSLPLDVPLRSSDTEPELWLIAPDAWILLDSVVVREEALP